MIRGLAPFPQEGPVRSSESQNHFHRKVREQPGDQGTAYMLAEGIADGMKTRSDEDEELMHKLDNLMKDPVKWREYVESRADKAIKHWPKR